MSSAGFAGVDSPNRAPFQLKVGGAPAALSLWRSVFTWALMVFFIGGAPA